MLKAWFREARGDLSSILQQYESHWVMVVGSENTSWVEAEENATLCSFLLGRAPLTGTQRTTRTQGQEAGQWEVSLLSTQTVSLCSHSQGARRARHGQELRYLCLWAAQPQRLLPKAPPWKKRERRTVKNWVAEIKASGNECPKSTPEWETQPHRASELWRKPQISSTFDYNVLKDMFWFSPALFVF